MTVTHGGTSQEPERETSVLPARVTVTEEPPNAETPLAALAVPLTPGGSFYVRSNFPLPDLSLADWRLVVDGEVERSCSLGWDELRALPEKTLAVTMECAGNGRLLMEPVPAGTPWNLGAVSTARFSGVPLRHILERARPTADALEVLFEGADGGTTETGEQAIFARSLPLDVALHPDTLLAWSIDDRPLPREHGYPLRLVVPGWYGMASVKWLARVHLIARPFDGFFQRKRYVYLQENGTPDGTPVTRMRVRAVIARPAQGDRVAGGVVEVAGTAWSGYGPVRRVEVSTDGGRSWADARLRVPDSPYACTAWRLEWEPPRPGSYEVVARATDAAGNRQPLEPVWNAQGYGNNVVHRVVVRVD
jgi:sulfite oxidase